GQFKASSGIGQIAFGLVDGGLECSRVQLSHDLVGFHLGIVIREKLLDVAGDLAADLDIDDGIQLAGGSNNLSEVSTRHEAGLVLGSIVMVAREIPNAAADGGG